MKLTIGIDPGKSGGYAIGWGGLHSINLHSIGEDFEFVEHIQDLKDHPDVTSIEAVVELVPPFAGKNIPSSSSFKLGKSCGFLEGVLRMAEIPFTLVRPQDWQKGLGGLTKLTSGKRKKVLMNHAKQFFPSTKGITLKTADAILILRHFLINK
tara:strand:- start:1222 stop:1680 length:459 start_codon:yes stop_codon:yes gene_type:complete